MAILYDGNPPRLWLSGEMELPIGLRCHEAYALMAHIAEECGYLVGKRGQSVLHVSGGDIEGYYVLDWYDGERPGPVRIEHWTCKWQDIEDMGSVEDPYDDMLNNTHPQDQEPTA